MELRDESPDVMGTDGRQRNLSRENEQLAGPADGGHGMGDCRRCSASSAR